MDEKLSRVEDKLDKLDDRFDQMNITLVKNTELLDYHIKRTDSLEEFVKAEKISRDEDMKPIREHVVTVKLVGKIVVGIAGFVVVLAGFLLTLKELGFLKFLQ